MYIIKNRDGKYLARIGAKSPKTNKLQHARVFATIESAKQECIENERVISVDNEMYSEGTY
jgi:hypothetical protein